MASADYLEWENIISTYVNGAPLPAMQDAVRAAVIQFCQLSRIVRRQVSNIDIEASHPDIQLPDSDDGLIPDSVIVAYGEHGPLCNFDYEDLLEECPTGYGKESVTSLHSVRAWIQRDPTTIYLFPRLSVDLPGALTCDIVYRPKRNSLKAPRFLYEMYADEIGWGACAILHSHSNAPYAEPEKVAALSSMFKDGWTSAANKSTDGHGKLRRRTRVRGRA